MTAMWNRNCQQIQSLHLLTWIPCRGRRGHTWEDLKTGQRPLHREAQSSHHTALVHFVSHLSWPINTPSPAPVTLSGVKNSNSWDLFSHLNCYWNMQRSIYQDSQSLQGFLIGLYKDSCFFSLGRKHFKTLRSGSSLAESMDCYNSSTYSLLNNSLLLTLLTRDGSSVDPFLDWYLSFNMQICFVLHVESWPAITEILVILQRIRRGCMSPHVAQISSMFMSESMGGVRVHFCN